MASSAPRSLSVKVGDSVRVSGLLQKPRHARACLVLAHGAGAGMTHPFLAALADGLCAAGIATCRFQFPFAEAGRRRPDAPALCHAAIRAVVNEAHRRVPALPLFAGGKSFGGRMTSQAQAEAPLPAVRGLVFVGFPLHPPQRPAIERAAHLQALQVPMLFLQGARDALAETRLIRSVCRKLGRRATLTMVSDADHAFHVPVRSGRTDAEVRELLIRTTATWIDAVVERP